MPCHYATSCHKPKALSLPTPHSCLFCFCLRRSGLLALASTEKKCKALGNAKAMLDGLKLEDIGTRIAEAKTRLTQPPAKAKGGVAMFTMCASEFCLSFVDKNPTPPQIQRGLNDIYKLVYDDFQLKKEDLPNSVKEKLDSLAKTSKDEARAKDKARMPPPPAPASPSVKRSDKA